MVDKLIVRDIVEVSTKGGNKMNIDEIIKNDILRWIKLDIVRKCDKINREIKEIIEKNKKENEK